MIIEVYVGRYLHGQREWPMVPNVGHMVWVDKGSSPYLEKDGYVRVHEVRWPRGDHWPVKLMCAP